uniref:Murine leukemia virus integrase C-terminal domain-containing protein n=1 Tax=Myotis myotis TaxID=51298 RepID=A0A7J7RCL8_MYOMY|nr:hypothetical protein mMyoMyo1_010838 [Myotis myotis]
MSHLDLQWGDHLLQFVSARSQAHLLLCPGLIVPLTGSKDLLALRETSDPPQQEVIKEEIQLPFSLKQFGARIHEALQTSSAAVHQIAWAAHQEARAPNPNSPPVCAPRDLVWVKRHDPGTLEPQWEGPFQVILSTPTAVKAWGKKRWIHRTHIKKAGRKQNQ